MIQVDNKSCTGCRACEYRCPKKCISMIQDKEGFLIAKANMDECVECGVCDKICPQNKIPSKSDRKDSFAATLTQKGTLMNSTSGGAFVALANAILDFDGIVFGAAFINKFEVEHISISNRDDLYRLQGSKYVQSNTKNTYKEVEKYLKSGKKVLYSGTACQIAGLYAYLGKVYDNLCTVDVICHGVPSPLIFKTYGEYLENLEHGNIKEYHFRAKSNAGWGNYGKIIYSNNKTKLIASNDPYLKCYLLGLLNRECCYNCQYSGENRIADITLGDYWGVQSCNPEYYNKYGVSAIVVNTKKGKAYLEDAKKYLIINKVEFNSIKKGNEQLNHPSLRPDSRDFIYQGINGDSHEYVVKKLIPWVNKKDILIGFIPRGIKNSIKRIKKGF